MELNLPDSLSNIKKVAVLFGATGAEREISLLSGRNIASALRELDLFEIIEHDYRPDKPEILNEGSIDVFFLAFHGQFGEGGEIQKLCENKRLVFTGSGSEASRLCFDKIACKKAFLKYGFKTAGFIEINSGHLPTDIDDKLTAMACDKFVIKPSCQGSSVGVSIVKTTQQAKESAIDCFKNYGTAMIEQFITGREITVGLLAGKPLPIIEIIPSGHEFYDYTAKYDDNATQYLFDTITDCKLIRKINCIAVDAFEKLNCKDFARIDMFIDGNENIYIIEINTIPGFTSHSLLPKAAAKAGINCGKLCLDIIQSALQRELKKVG